MTNDIQQPRRRSLSGQKISIWNRDIRLHWRLQEQIICDWAVTHKTVGKLNNVSFATVVTFKVAMFRIINKKRCSKPQIAEPSSNCFAVLLEYRHPPPQSHRWTLTAPLPVHRPHNTNHCWWVSPSTSRPLHALLPPLTSLCCRHRCSSFSCYRLHSPHHQHRPTRRQHWPACCWLDKKQIFFNIFVIYVLIIIWCLSFYVIIVMQLDYF